MPQTDRPYDDFYQAFHKKKPKALLMAKEAAEDIQPPSPVFIATKSCGKFPPPALVIPSSRKLNITILPPTPKPQATKQKPPIAPQAKPKVVTKDQKAPSAAKPIPNHSAGLFSPRPQKKSLNYQLGQAEKPGKKNTG